MGVSGGSGSFLGVQGQLPSGVAGKPPGQVSPVTGTLCQPGPLGADALTCRRAAPGRITAHSHRALGWAQGLCPTCLWAAVTKESSSSTLVTSTSKSPPSGEQACQSAVWAQLIRAPGNGSRRQPVQLQGPGSVPGSRVLGAQRQEGQPHSLSLPGTLSQARPQPRPPAPRVS